MQRWSDDITNWFGCSLLEAVTLGNDRDRWHEMSNGVDGLKEEVEKKTPAIAMQWSILHTTPVKE